MTPFRDQPIGRKVTLLIVLASVVVLVLAASGLLFYEISTVQPRVLRDLRSQAALLRTNTAAALDRNDAIAARKTLATLRVKSEIGAAALYDVTGALFAGYVRSPRPPITLPAAAPAQGVQVHGRLIAIMQPVRAEGELVGSLALWYELPPLSERMLGYAVVAITVLAALFTVAVLMSWLLRTKLSRPMLRLASTAQAITERGDYTVRAEKYGDDEVGQLTESFNAMLDAIQARDIALQRSAEQLIQSQKMEAIGRLAGGIAHDFNNLLTAILGYARFALTTLPPDSPAREDIEQIEEAGARAASLTAQLLAYARRQIIAPKTVDLNAVVSGMDELLRRLIGEDIVLTTQYDRALWPVRVDAGQFEQVVLNLAINARDAMPGGGTLVLETRNAVLDGTLADAESDVAPGNYAALVVRDTGTGMDAATRAQIFEPFFTTKEQGKGTGLGLAVCYGILKQAEGYITVDTAPGAGTTFTVYLPRDTDHDVVEAPHAAEVLPAPRGTETVLVVEDDPSVRQLTVRGLRMLGYTVLEASDGDAAALVAKKFPLPIDLLLVDVVMPGIDGNAVAERLTVARPGMRVIFMSGYTDHPAIRQGVADDERLFIAKPFELRRLGWLVREVLDGVVHPKSH